MHKEELESLVLKHLTEDFFSGGIRAIFEARQLAHQLCVNNFDPADARDIRPWIRRGKINEYLRGIADRIPECVATVAQSPGSPIKRTELRAGPVSLTAHAVQTPCGQVKNYKYRVSLAHDNPPTLFDVEFPIGDTLNTVLLHGPFRARTPAEQVTYDYLPGSIYLAFPTAGANEYVHSVDLISRFPDLIDSFLPKEWDENAKSFYRYYAVAREIG